MLSISNCWICLKGETVWFTSAKSAGNWFRKRRSIHFDKVEVIPDCVKIRLSSDNDEDLPGLSLRIYVPGAASEAIDYGRHQTVSCIDIPWAGEAEIEVPV